jgi:hypothetical protein
MSNTQTAYMEFQFHMFEASLREKKIQKLTLTKPKIRRNKKDIKKVIHTEKKSEKKKIFIAVPRLMIIPNNQSHEIQ